MVKLTTALSSLPLLFAAALASDDCPKVGARAIYFLSNEDKNSVVSLKVNADGTLSDGLITSTGGKGGAGIMNDMPAGPDPLFSQGSVAVDGGYLVAVNPGSNSLSLFQLDKEDPTKLHPVGKPVDTNGDFPTTVAVSAELSQACVANTGARAGVSCFDITKDGLSAQDKTLRAFDLGQQTPPTGPVGTVSHALFTEDCGALIVQVKGDPNTNATGFAAVYPVEGHKVAKKPVKSTPEGTAVLFGTVQIPGTRRFVTTDASLGGGVLELKKDGKIKTVILTEVADQMATCWAAYSESTDTAYVTDVAVNRLIGIDPSTGDINSETTLDNGNAGMLDLAAAGDFVYALAAGGDTATVVVLDVSGGNKAVKHVQNFQPKNVPNAARIQGMAFCD